MESEEYGCDLRTEEGWREVMARYWGNATLVDRSVANILAALDECGLADDTIVVFTSDHGEQLGDHGILGKTLMYEESVRVPMLLRAPMLDAEPRRMPPIVVASTLESPSALGPISKSSSTPST